MVRTKSEMYRRLQTARPGHKLVKKKLSIEKSILGPPGELSCGLRVESKNERAARIGPPFVLIEVLGLLVNSLALARVSNRAF